MTDYQRRTLLKMLCFILDGCRDLKEAREKIAELLHG